MVVRRIIPFVAADALVNDKEESGVGISGVVTGYPPRVGVAVPPPLPPEHSRTDAANFYDIVTQENRFSPPKKTEGILCSSQRAITRASICLSFFFVNIRLTSENFALHKNRRFRAERSDVL